MKQPTRWILCLSCLILIGYFALVWSKYIQAPAELQQLHENMTLVDVYEFLDERGYDLILVLRKTIHGQPNQGLSCLPTNRHDEALIRSYLENLTDSQECFLWQRGDEAILVIVSEDDKLLQKDFYRVKNRPYWRSLLDLVWQ